MVALTPELAPEQRIIGAIDTSDITEAHRLLTILAGAGAAFVKLGLEASTRLEPETDGWRRCSILADTYGMEWVADAKLYDISNTVEKTVSNIINAGPKPPVGLTIATRSGIDSMRLAQEVANEKKTTMLGVTVLTSHSAEEVLEYEGKTPREVVWNEARRAVAAGIGGVVCSGQEVGMLKNLARTRGLFTMIPGTRSTDAETHDQKRSVTPTEAIADGADLLVIGRQITKAEDPAAAFAALVEEIKEGRALRNS